MLSWALMFLVVAVISATLGFFGDIGGAATGIAQILFFVFVVLFVVSLVLAATERRRL